MYERFSSLVSAGVPCFFYTDFEGLRLHCYRLDELSEHDIEFSFNHPPHKSNFPHKPDFQPVSLHSYREKFDSVQEHIRSGNTYLLNLTQPTPIQSTLTLHEIYSMANAPYKLRVKNQFVCFSPEPFITIKNDTINTFPMKGTIDATIPDALNILLNDPKEIAEHTMIVDLLRNDLGIVANNIRVEKFRYVTTLNTGDKHLHQISSHISGNLESSWRENAGKLLKSLLPAGSISGTPKQKTLQIIREVEGYSRDYFTGVFGYFDGNNLYSAVAIRFIENIAGEYVYKSGGGITAESDCKREYDEMIDKIYIP